MSQSQSKKRNTLILRLPDPKAKKPRILPVNRNPLLTNNSKNINNNNIINNNNNNNNNNNITNHLIQNNAQQQTNQSSLNTSKNISINNNQSSQEKQESKNKKKMKKQKQKKPIQVFERKFYNWIEDLKNDDIDCSFFSFDVEKGGIFCGICKAAGETGTDHIHTNTHTCTYAHKHTEIRE